MLLSDIGITASPKTLRELADFFVSAAREMEELGDEFGHVHLMDEWTDWHEGLPDIQILCEKDN